MTRLSVVPWSSWLGGWAEGWYPIPQNQAVITETKSRQNSLYQGNTVARPHRKWRPLQLTDQMEGLCEGLTGYVPQGTKRIGEVRWGNVMCIVLQKWAETNKLNEHNSFGKRTKWLWTNQLAYKQDKWAEHAANKNIFNIFNLGPPHCKSTALNTQPCYLIKGSGKITLTLMSSSLTSLLSFKSHLLPTNTLIVSEPLEK